MVCEGMRQPWPQMSDYLLRVNTELEAGHDVCHVIAPADIARHHNFVAYVYNENNRYNCSTFQLASVALIVFPPSLHYFCTDCCSGSHSI